MSSHFDIAAATYDNVFTHSSIGRAQRKRVQCYFEKIYSTPKHILELNCGTGEDALWLAKRGHDVVATDVSEAMVSITKEKCESKGVISFSLNINDLAITSFDHQFDVVFSNFGGLNCLSKKELRSFLTCVSEKVTDNGQLVFVIMPRNCLWERLYFILKGNMKAARRRKKTDSILANVEDEQVPTWYYNPKEIIALASDKFKVTKVKPIGLFIPPSYLEPFFKSKQWFLSILVAFERCFSFSVFSKYADHYIITLSKK